MLRAVADTHSVIWYLFADPRLSNAARSTFEEAAAAGDQIGFSSITLAEIVYLSEKGRIREETLERLLETLEARESVLVEIPFDRAVAKAMLQVSRADVPDLPDRIIAATAVRLETQLISRDREIRLSSVSTIW